MELLQGPKSPAISNHFCFVASNFDAAFKRLSEEAKLEVVTKPHPTGARQTGEENWRRVAFKGPSGEDIEMRGP